MALKLITAPVSEPIDLTTAKSHLRVDTIDDDSLITSLIIAAREYAQGFQNRAFVTQTYELWLDAWPEYIQIPRPPLQSITSIKYYGTDNAEYTLAPADYFVDSVSEPGRAVLAYGKSWPSTTLRPANGIVVTFVAGYGAVASVPQQVKQAMLLLIGHWNENREAAISGAISREIEFAVHALLTMDRVVPV
ncbi:MAG: head-tail connector protein [Clostridia bacterium]|nr:head-tail connector protein [Clostridia bacterium]